MSFTKEDVRKVASLARLSFEENELEPFATQLSAILGHIEQLSKLNTDNIAPTAYTNAAATPQRNDQVQSNASRDVILDQAPDREGPLFKVPKVIG